MNPQIKELQFNTTYCSLEKTKFKTLLELEVFIFVIKAFLADVDLRY